MRKPLPFFIIAVQALIIIGFIALTFSGNSSTVESDFSFDRRLGYGSAYSFDFVFLKEHGTNGIISLDNDGNFELVFLRDAGGEEFVFNFDDGRLIYYIIKSGIDTYGYELGTYFFRDLTGSTDGSDIIAVFREEKIKDIKHHYFIDYSKSPFLSFELPENLGSIGIFRIRE